MTDKCPWMPLYIADYLKDTQHLTRAQHGSYLLLIFEYWLKGSLPNDENILRSIAKMTPQEWRAERKSMMSFFQTSSDNKLLHKRVESELSKALGKIRRNQEKAKMAAQARWSSKHAPSNAPSISPSNARSMLQALPGAMHTSHKNIKPSFESNSEDAQAMLQASSKDPTPPADAAPATALSGERAVAAPASDPVAQSLAMSPANPAIEDFAPRWAANPKNRSFAAQAIQPSESLLRIEYSRQLGRRVTDAEFQRYLEQRNA